MEDKYRNQNRILNKIGLKSVIYSGKGDPELRDTFFMDMDEQIGNTPENVAPVFCDFIGKIIIKKDGNKNHCFYDDGSHMDSFELCEFDGGYTLPRSVMFNGKFGTSFDKIDQ